MVLRLMSDLRVEFEKVLHKYGHYVLLVRQNKKVPLPKSYTANLGLSYGYTIEKHLCRSQTASIPETLPRMVKGQIAGEVSVSSKMFYLKHDVFPSRGDLIIECSWNGNRPIIDEYSGIYEINYPEPYRGLGGRIEYFRAACELDPIEATVRLQTIAGKDYIIVDRRDGK